MENRALKDAPRVLVVDDEKAIRDILSEILSIEGFAVITAASGEEALRTLSDHKIDILVTDLEMPGMKGTDLLKRVVDTHKGIATIMMTGYGTVETAIEAMKLGAYDYILKPFKMDQVTLLVRRALEKLRLEEENIQLKETLYLFNLSEIMGTSLDLDYLLEIIMETLMEEVGADVTQLYLKHSDAAPLMLHSQRIRDSLDVSSGDIAMDIGTVTEALEKDEVVLFQNGRLMPILKTDKVVSFIAIPLKHAGRLVGMIDAFSLTEGKNFTEGQRKTLTIVAGRAAAQIENARLYTDLERTFKETIQGLTRALEAKDKYTQGHSERVTEYARIVAENMEMSPNEIEDVIQAARLHDIGKIGIQLELINKPGKLTVEEISMFREHPVLSKKILEPIRFLQGILPLVYHHHERWDGMGYPDKLRGKRIPLGARILAVADSYAVMTENRPYRKALSHEEAIEELRRCAGTQFDPDVVGVFVSCFGKTTG